MSVRAQLSWSGVVWFVGMWLVASASVLAQPAVTLHQVISIPGTATDRSQLSEEILPGTPHNQFGGVSAIEWTGTGDEYWVLPDRGPSDGAANYHCRVHRVRLPLGEGSRQPEILETIMLVDQRGAPFLGSSAMFVATADQMRRLDPEGLRLDSAGNFLISDEYGPQVIRFSRSGRFIEELPVPSAFPIDNPSADAQEEDANNQKGRRSNRGMEGLAISPNGESLVGLMQSPLLQDAERNASGKAVGLNSRIWRYDLRRGIHQQFVYRQDHRDHKMHEILALDDMHFLVIEQDGKAGENAAYKKIVSISLRGATEIANEIVLPPGDLPASIRPANKTDFIDLLAPEFGLAGPAMPEKIEGLCWGPHLADGRRLLVVATDNDFKSNQDSLFYFFAVGEQ